MINDLVQIIVAESYIFIRQVPTSCYLHSLNTFEVSVHWNWTVHSA